MERYGVEFLLPGVIAFVIAACIGPVVIPFLARIKAGQTVRDEGPEEHLKKNGTPTMGGFIFLIPFWLVCLFYLFQKNVGDETVAILISVTGFAFIGFLDDFIKVVLKRSMGLRAWQKFSLQILLAIALIWYMYAKMKLGTQVYIPFTNIQIDLGAGLYVLEMILILGTVNGSNFTDGLDGLAGSVTTVICLFIFAYAVSVHSKSSVSAIVLAGALLGFLLYNSHRASVFMGDTGSLALGGFVAVACSIQGQQLLVPFVALIYVIEVLSVIIQVSYFKLTGGKRVFRMAPIHHHFELCGWKETKVVAVFTIITAVICAVALFNMEIRL